MASSVDPENPTREQCVFLAKLAEQTERYDDMLEFMQKLVRSITPAEDLTAEERNLVSASFKNMVGSIRATWRIVSAITLKEESRGNKDKAAMARAYKSTLELRLSCICGNVLGLLESNLLPSATASDSKVFYLKMKGDYNRYLAEVRAGNERMDAADNTLESYQAAQDIAHAYLAPSNPIRLGLALNFSVFNYEILNQTDKAYEMAKQAFEEGLIELGTLGEESNKDSTLIMQLLRDNLTVWTSSSQDQIIEIKPEIS